MARGGGGMLLLTPRGGMFVRTFVPESTRRPHFRSPPLPVPNLNFEYFSTEINEAAVPALKGDWLSARVCSELFF